MQRRQAGDVPARGQEAEPAKGQNKRQPQIGIPLQRTWAQGVAQGPQSWILTLLGPRDPDSCQKGAGGAPASIAIDIASDGGTATCFRPDSMFFGIFFWKFWPETGLDVPARPSTPEQARSEEKNKKTEIKSGVPRWDHFGS